MYRLAADVFNDTAMILDCLSPAFPKPLRVIVLSFSSVLRSLCGVCAGSAKASLSAHFARMGNLGEVNAVSLLHVHSVGIRVYKNFLLRMECGVCVHGVDESYIGHSKDLVGSGGSIFRNDTRLTICFQKDSSQETVISLLGMLVRSKVMISHYNSILKRSTRAACISMWELSYPAASNMLEIVSPAASLPDALLLISALST